MKRVGCRCPSDLANDTEFNVVDDDFTISGSVLYIMFCRGICYTELVAFNWETGSITLCAYLHIHEWNTMRVAKPQ